MAVMIADTAVGISKCKTPQTFGLLGLTIAIMCIRVHVISKDVAGGYSLNI
jgi:hypothetical protein